MATIFFTEKHSGARDCKGKTGSDNSEAIPQCRRNMNTTPLNKEDLKQGSYITNFCFTLNNWTQLEYDALIRFDCKWIVIGKEIGKEQTPHLQGACCLNRNIRFSTLKKKPGFERAHIERMIGTPHQSLVYCSKEDPEPFMKGTMPEVTQGRREDLLAVVKQLKVHQNIQTLCINDDQFCAMYIKYCKGITSLSSLLEPGRTGPPVVIWLHGPTGTGKTRSSVEFGMAVNMPMWISSGSLQWFDGYRGERLAILDDFRTGHCKFSFLLRLLDRYIFSVPVKGAFSNWKPDVIIITAPLSPREMFDLKNEGDIGQLERRITHVVQSPVTVKQLLVLPGLQQYRGKTPLVDKSSGLPGNPLISLEEKSSSSTSDTEELSYEEQKNLKRDLDIATEGDVSVESSAEKRAKHHLSHFMEIRK